MFPSSQDAFFSILLLRVGRKLRLESLLLVWLIFGPKFVIAKVLVNDVTSEKPAGIIPSTQHPAVMSTMGLYVLTLAVGVFGMDSIYI